MQQRIVWRFYLSEESGWSWQRLSTDGTVLAESPSLYSEYAICVAAAANEGYLHEASQDHLLRHDGGMRCRA